MNALVGPFPFVARRRFPTRVSRKKENREGKPWGRMAGKTGDPSPVFKSLTSDQKTELEIKMLVLRGSLDDVLHKVKEQRSRYRGHPESLSEIDFLERIINNLQESRWL